MRERIWPMNVQWLQILHYGDAKKFLAQQLQLKPKDATKTVLHFFQAHPIPPSSRLLC